MTRNIVQNAVRGAEMRRGVPKGLASFLLTAVLIGCGAPAIPAAAPRTVLSLGKLDCAGCGEDLASKLGKHPGVYQATFDKVRSEVTVVALPSVDVLTSARNSAAGEEFVLELGAGKGSYVPWAKAPEGADVAVLATHGEDVPELAPHLALGKVTVVDFAAAWCEPCRNVDAHLMEVVGKRKDVAYRKLDIGDWDTPLAQRYLKGVPSLPYVLVFGKDTKRVAEIKGLDLARLDAAIEEAAR